MQNVTTPLSRLKQERLRRGWSLTNMTQKTGIHTASLSLVERGLIVVHPGWQARLARAFDMPTEELFENKAVRPALTEAA